MLEQKFDFIIIGSGFGGSISAMRLSQKGYRVLVLEKGKRYRTSDFPESNWNIRKYLWLPLLRCFGIQQISLFKGLMLLHGAGVGGGSLVYANTLMEPPHEVFKIGWPQGLDWKNELAPYYVVAKKMLGVTTNKFPSDADFALRKLGEDLKVPESYHLTEVGVFFGEPGKEVIDPYFSGEGPMRTGCTGCGGCMIGCRVGAKNTLDKNYLYFAEKNGAVVLPETTVRNIVPLDAGGFRVDTCSTTSLFLARKKSFVATKVIVAAGVIGTLKLLFHCKIVTRSLEKISDRLGSGVRTNGESLCGVTATSGAKDFSRGIAIGSAIHPDAVTKIEPCRYPSGSSVMRFLAGPLTENGSRITRPLKFFLKLLTHFSDFRKLVVARDWAKQSIILLVMQSIDTQLRFTLKRKWWFLGRHLLTTDSSGPMVPSYLESAQVATQSLARIIDGVPQNSITEVVLGASTTAHILGGANMGTGSDVAVVDLNHEVFHYPGLYVCDGSIIPANLAVNPSLTISALAERFATQF